MSDGSTDGERLTNLDRARGRVFLELRRLLAAPRHKASDLEHLRIAAQALDGLEQNPDGKKNENKLFELVGALRGPYTSSYTKTAWLRLLSRFWEDSESIFHLLCFCPPGGAMFEDAVYFSSGRFYEELKKHSPFGESSLICFTDDGGKSLRQVSVDLYNLCMAELGRRDWLTYQDRELGQNGDCQGYAFVWEEFPGNAEAFWLGEHGVMRSQPKSPERKSPDFFPKT